MAHLLSKGVANAATAAADRGRPAWDALTILAAASCPAPEHAIVRHCRRATRLDAYVYPRVGRLWDRSFGTFAGTAAGLAGCLLLSTRSTSFRSSAAGLRLASRRHSPTTCRRPCNVRRVALPLPVGARPTTPPARTATTAAAARSSLPRQERRCSSRAAAARKPPSCLIRRPLLPRLLCRMRPV